MCIQNLVKFCPFVLKILRGNEILTSIKGHNSITNVRKIMFSNPNLELVNMNVYTKALEQMQSNTDLEAAKNNVMDAYKILCLSVKTTNSKRLELIKKRMQGVVPRRTNSAKLLGDNFQEAVKSWTGQKEI